jgi:hypothetical protein
MYGSPSQCKTFVIPELFPHFESFFSAQGPAFNQTVGTTMLKAILEAAIIETGDGYWLRM